VPAEILRWLAKENFNNNAFGPASKYLLMLVPRDEVMPDDFLFLARSQSELRLFKECGDSVQSYLKVVKGPAPRATALLLLARSQIELKSLDAGQKSVEEAITLQPEGDINGEARIVAGDIQIARGKPDEAAKLYESVFATGIDHPEITPRALEKAVKAYREAGLDDKAKKALNLLQSRYPEYIQKNKTP
jgi:tetratricopeptide (TPR) repeat protein